MGASWRRTSAFALLYTLALLAGNATRLESGQLALVWPASAVAFLWVVGSWSAPAARLRDVAALSAVACLGQLLTGRPGLLALSLTLAGTAQAILASLVFSRLVGDRRLQTLRALLGLLMAAVAGSCAGAALAALAFTSVRDVALLPLAGQWVLRNAVSIFVLAAVGLVARGRAPREAVPSGRTERAVLALVGATVYALVFGVSRGMPLAFVVLPMGVWVGLRCSTAVTARVNVVVAFAVMLLTMHGSGPFGSASRLALTDRVLLAQTFIAVAALLSLVLALYRDALHEVTYGLGLARQAAVEQAELLATVFESISDGVLVVAADGRAVMHNAAARELLGFDLDLAERPAWSQYRRLSHPDGSELASDDLPLARALRGHRDTGVDILARSPAHPEGLVLNATARPLPGAPGAHGAVTAFHDVTFARLAAAEVEAARDLLATVLSSATEQAIISTDVDGLITLFNTGAEQLLGRRAVDMIGRSPAVLHDPVEVAARAAELGIEPGFAVFVSAVAPGRPETRAWTYVTADGGRRDVILSITALQAHGGALTGYLGIAVDVSERRRAERALEVSEVRFRQAFTTAPMGMFLSSLPPGGDAGRMIQVNAALCDLLGRTPEQVLTEGIGPFVHPEDAPAMQSALTRLREGAAERVRAELRFVRPDGRPVWGLVSASWVLSDDDGDGQLVGLVEDVTARKQAEETLTQQALHDPLTGLPNRTLLLDRLTHALSATERSGGGIGVLYLDLDGFKAVNDSAGHAAGDELLRQVARRLTNTVRPGDTVARLGGDEFVVFCSDTEERRNLRAVAERVVQVLRRPFFLKDGSHSVSVSVGLALSGSGSTPAQLLQDADAAMYSAKRAGKDRLGVHDEDRTGAELPKQRDGSVDVVEPVDSAGQVSSAMEASAKPRA